VKPAHTASELVGAALLAALGVAFALGGLGYGVLNEQGRIGTGFMPFVAGVLLVFFGAVIAVETLAAARRTAAPAGEAAGERSQSLLELALSQDDTEQGVPDEEPEGRSVAAVFALALVAVLLIPFAGFLISFGLLLFVLVTFVEREGVVRGLVVSLVAVAVTWLLFQRLLGVPLPGGYPGLWLGG
jgi:putative tricarboxylic transport membrane protein